MELRAVLFDLDGTLVDSPPLWRDAFAALVRSRQGTLPPGALENLDGIPTADAVATVGRRLGWPEAGTAADVRWVEDRVRARYRTAVPWRSGARELVAAVRAAGLATGLVTSCGREVVAELLASGTRPRFDVVVCREDVTAPKPAPEPYLTAARRLRAPPADCVVVEDSRPGVASAAAAGCAVVAYGPDVSCQGLPRCRRADRLTALTVPDLADLARH